MNSVPRTISPGPPSATAGGQSKGGAPAAVQRGLQADAPARRCRAPHPGGRRGHASRLRAHARPLRRRPSRQTSAAPSAAAASRRAAGAGVRARRCRRRSRPHSASACASADCSTVRPGLARPGAGRQRGGHGLDRRHLVLPQRQPEAAFGLGAHVPPQAEARRPARGQRRQRRRRAADEFEFDLVDRHAAAVGDDAAMVVGDLDHAHHRGARGGAGGGYRCGRAYAVRRCHPGRPAPQQHVRPPAVPAWRRGSQRRFAALRRQAHLVLQPPHQAVAAALQRLHPDPALLAQAQRQASGRQALVGGIGVERPAVAPCAPRPWPRHAAAPRCAPAESGT